VHIVAYEPYLCTPDLLLIGTAAWAAPVSPLHRSALLGQGLLWRSLDRSLRGNFKACAAQLLLQPGGGGCSSSVLTDTLLQAKNKSL